MIKPVGLLLLSELLERFTWYGVRSILILYMLHDLQLDRSDAVTWYGLMTTAIYFISVLGGLLGDLTRRSPLFLVIGSGLSTLGMALLAFGGQPGLIPAILLIALGSGIFKPNMISTLYSQIANRRRHFDGIFILLYLVINIGAFLAPLAIGVAADTATPDYQLGFLICTGVSLINTIILLLGLSFKVFDNSTIESLIKSFRLTGAGMAKVTLFLVAGIIFWILYEMVPQISGCDRTDTYWITGTLALFVFGALFTGLGFIPEFRPVYKIGAGFVVISVLILLADQLGCPAGPYLTAAAEILIIPILIGQIAANVSPRFVGTWMGVYFFVVMISNKATGVIYGMPADLKSFTACVFAGVALAICAVLVVLDRKNPARV